MTIITGTVTLPSPLPYPGKEMKQVLDERGGEEETWPSPLPLQSSVLQIPQAELGFSTINPIKPLILLAGSSNDTVSQGSGDSGLGY